MRFCFSGWRETDVSSVDYFAYGTSLAVWRLGHVARLTVKALQLKRALQSARQTALRDDLCDLSESSPATDVLKVVQRHVGSTNRKQQKLRALPMLRTEAGHLCSTADQLRDRWIDYFGAMEGATRV